MWWWTPDRFRSWFQPSSHVGDFHPNLKICWTRRTEAIIWRFKSQTCVLLDDQYIFQLHLFLHLNLHIIRPTDLQRRLERQQDNIYIWSLSFLENNVKAAASLHILGKRTKWWANQNHCVVVAAFLWKWMTWDEMSLLLNLQSILGSEVPQRLIRRTGKQPQVTVLLWDTDRRHRVVILCFIIKIYNYKLV